MIRKAWIMMAVAFAVFFVSSLQKASAYDPVTEFSVTNNPSGVWSYGHSATVGGSLNLYSTGFKDQHGADIWLTAISSPAPSIVSNSTSEDIALGSNIAPAQALSLHPAPNGEFSVLRFTAVFSGTYHVVGSWYGVDTNGTTTDVHIVSGTTVLCNGTVSGFGVGTGPSFDTVVTLNAGEFIDFAVGIGPDNDYNYDSTGLDLQVDLVSEPTISYDLLAYSVITEIGSGDAGRPYLISDQTGVGPFGGLLRKHKLRKHLLSGKNKEFVSAETVDSFLAANSTSQQLVDAFPAEFNHYLWPVASFGPQVIRVSAVGFNSAGTEALVYVGHTGRSGHFLVLNKVGSLWTSRTLHVPEPR
jgi:hypothetical protein